MFDVGVFGGADCAHEEREVRGCYVGPVVEQGRGAVVPGAGDE